MTRTIAGGGTAELEVGKVYLNRLGLACRIVRQDQYIGLFVDETGYGYTSHGQSLNRNNDLIQELEAPCDTPPK